MSAKKKWIIAGAVSAAAVGLGLWGIGSFVSSRLAIGTGGVETATVGAEVIETTVVGSGTLAYGDAETVSLPSGVEVTSIFYEQGQQVESGDLLAAVDTGSLEILMNETYAQIVDVDAKLRDTSSDPERVVVTAPVAGRVQTIYAANGSSVLETIARSGSLMIISPDGRLRVEVQSETLPQVGSDVELVLPDGAVKKAQVENVRRGAFTAALTDPSLDAGTTVELRTADGSMLGSGQLEAVDAVSVIGPAGTVEGITVGPGSEVKAGTDLFSVRSTSPPAAYQELDRQRQTLTQRYDSLAELHQNGGLVAPVSGVITSCAVQEGSPASEGADAASLADGLAGLPAGLLDAMGMGRHMEMHVVTERLGLQQGGENLMLSEEMVADEPDEPEPPAEAEPDEPPDSPAPADPTSAPLPSYVPREIPRLTVPLVPPIPGLPLQHEADLLPLCTGTISWDPADEQAQFATKYTATGELQALDGFVFASDCSLKVLCGEVTACSVSGDGRTVRFTAAYEQTPDEITAPKINWEKIKDLLNLDSVDLSDLLSLISSGLLPSDVLGSLGTDLSGLLSGADLSDLAGLDMSALGGLDASALAGLSPEALAGLDAAALAGLDTSALADSLRGSEVPAYTIAQEGSMQLLIQINQLDVLSVTPGMACEVTVDALEGEVFQGTVADVAGTDNNNGTYTAKITLEKTPQMRSGMSASAVITTSETDSAMTLPAAAIQEEGNRIFVYTSYDAGSGTFGGEKEIETGVSDGSSVEVLSGLEDGETVYYASASPLERMMDSMGGPMSAGNSEESEGQMQITIDTADQ